MLTALRKKCLPCRENSAYRTKKNLLTGWRKYSLPHDGKFILPCIKGIYNDETGNKLMMFHIEDATAVDIPMMGEGEDLLK